MDAMSAFRPQRAISSRGLARGLSNILDEIEETGRAVAVVRYGRIAAILAPMHGSSRIGNPSAWQPHLPPLDEELEEESIELSPLAREVLNAIADADNGLWGPNDPLGERTVSQRIVGCGELELSGLADRFGARFRLTKKGRRFVDQVSVRSAAERDG
jgi:hypothetical protein